MSEANESPANASAASAWSEAVAAAQAAFSAQPFSALVGAELVAFEPGTAEVRIPFRPELLQQFGFLHGGVIAYAIDNAVTFAAGTRLGLNLLTSGITVSYIRPVTGDLRAVATVVGTTRRQAVVRCEVYSEGQSGSVLAASGQGTAVVAAS
ncbi:MAG TPA: PaaI family thioesterase [Leifsonia sp.]|nr:PaaI family thioesterase [Leifsonia sp.]